MILKPKILKGGTILDLNWGILNVVLIHKYLGHYITDDLSYDADINRTLFVQGNLFYLA